MMHILWRSIIEHELPLLRDGIEQIQRHADEGDALLVRQTLCPLEMALQRIRNAVTMKADDVRKLTILNEKYHNDDVPVGGAVRDCAILLREIAAQLAELNEWLRTPQATKDKIEAQIRGR